MHDDGDPSIHSKEKNFFRAAQGETYREQTEEKKV